MKRLLLVIALFIVTAVATKYVLENERVNDTYDIVRSVVQERYIDKGTTYTDEQLARMLHDHKEAVINDYKATNDIHTLKMELALERKYTPITTCN